MKTELLERIQRLQDRRNLTAVPVMLTDTPSVVNYNNFHAIIAIKERMKKTEGERNQMRFMQMLKLHIVDKVNTVTRWGN